MHIVCQTGCQEIFDILASQKTSDSELKRKDRYNRLQPIFYAAIYGNSNIVRALIDKGCSIECVDEKGWLPWIHALWNGWIDTAAMLECKYKIVAHPLDVSFAEMPPLSLDNSTTEKENDENVLSLLFLPPPAIPTTGNFTLTFIYINSQCQANLL
jgi:ankyrin repeat protein